MLTKLKIFMVVAGSIVSLVTAYSAGYYQAKETEELKNARSQIATLQSVVQELISVLIIFLIFDPLQLTVNFFGH